MELSDAEGKAESGTEEAELAPAPDGEGQAPAPGEAPAPEGDFLAEMAAEAGSEIDGEGQAPAPGEAPAPEGDFLAEMGTEAGSEVDGEGQAPALGEAPAPEGDFLAEMAAEAGSEIDAARKAPENGAASPQTDAPLDPSLVELFRDARNEAQESALASELPDIPIQELLGDVVSLSQQLGITPRARADTASEGYSAKAKRSLRSVLAQLPTLGSRRQALHGLLLSLILAVAIASALMGANRFVSQGQDRDPSPSVSPTAHPGVVVTQVHPADPTPEPTPAATPQPTPTRQPAYFLYTVQRGDTLTDIARTFGISLDHILWTNPEVIDDPNLLLVGDKLLIPNVAGMIYYVKPGDILSAIGRVLPERGPEDSDPRPQQPQPP